MKKILVVFIILVISLSSVFAVTETTNEADLNIKAYKIGNYDKSADIWRDVLKMNGNYDQAYIGIGRALLRKGQYKDAMKYFELKLDTKNYSKAFKLYREEWFEENIGIILLILVILVLLGFGVGFVKKARREVEKG